MTNTTIEFIDYGAQGEYGFFGKVVAKLDTSGLTQAEIDEEIAAMRREHGNYLGVRTSEIVPGVEYRLPVKEFNQLYGKAYDRAREEIASGHSVEEARTALLEEFEQLEGDVLAEAMDEAYGDLARGLSEDASIRPREGEAAGDTFDRAVEAVRATHRIDPTWKERHS